MATPAPLDNRPSNIMNRNDTTTSEDEKISVATLSSNRGQPNATEKSSKIETNESKNDLEAGISSNGKDADGDDVLPKAPLTFPDGGFGWMVVLGAFMIQFW